MEWQPINTAPKDGTEVLVYQPITKEQYVAFFNKRENKWQFAVDTFLKDTPTHWMQLPEAPNEQK